MEQYFKISQEQVNALLNYLKGKPYAEVYQGIVMLSNLPPVIEKCKTEIKEEKHHSND